MKVLPFPSKIHDKVIIFAAVSNVLTLNENGLIDCQVVSIQSIVISMAETVCSNKSVMFHI